MSVSGQRKLLKQGILKILREWLMLEYCGDYDEVANDIMALVPKPEKTVIHRKETEIFKIPFYKCGKCGGIITCDDDGRGIDHYKFCPICGRRIVAWEDDTLCQ